MTKDEVLNAGVNHVPVAGHYFELLSTVTTVDVRAFDLDGNTIADEKGVASGYYIDRRMGGVKRFERLEIVAPGADRTKFLITDGYSGTKAVPLDVSSNAARLLGIVYGSLGQVAQELLNGVNALVVACKGTLGTLAQAAIGGVNSLVVTERGIKYGASYSTSSAPGANFATEVVAAAANTGGLIVWGAGLIPQVAGQNLSLIAKATAPTVITDGDVLLMAQSYTLVGALAEQLPRSIEVAAGKALYVFNDAAGQRTANVLYTIL